jgi:hypothetical protein
MSDPDFSTDPKTSPPKKPISPARNIIGVILLVAVVGVGILQYAQLLGYNAAVKALDTRAQDENAELMTVQEAEGLLAKGPDGPGTDFDDGNFHFLKKTYTWSGLLKSYTLTAYYTKAKDSRLNHYETDGAKLPPRPAAKPLPPGHSRSAPTKGASQTPKKPADTAEPKAKAAPDAAKPEKPAEGSKPGESSKPAEGSKPGESSKPAEGSKSDAKPAPAKDGN